MEKNYLPTSISDEGKRIDVFVAERETITRSAAQKLINNGKIDVNGNTVDKNYRIRSGDTVGIEYPEPVPSELEARDIPLDIVYEDSDLAVINKPKGLVVHPAAGHYDDTLVNALLYHCKDELSTINGEARPGIVHRIDRDTSGLIVVAKNDAAHVSLAEQISSHSFERRYRAVIIGRLRSEEGSVDAPIGRSPNDRKKMAVVNGGKNAVTHYKVLREYNGFSYIELQLETGRTHQIRVHMAHIGHPVLGDGVYGNGKNKFELRNNDILCGQCLHAATISFRHPKSGEFMHFESELPEYFKAILDKLERAAYE